VFIGEQTVGVVWAHIHAGPARDAPVRVVHELGPGLSTFRVMAPEAGHRAALQENGRPDSRSVVYREPLNVEYDAGFRHAVAPSMAVAL
jgi:hypothetical protein